MSMKELLRQLQIVAMERGRNWTALDLIEKNPQNYKKDAKNVLTEMDQDALTKQINILRELYERLKPLGLLD
jgi:hypothetical protein